MRPIQYGLVYSVISFAAAILVCSLGLLCLVHYKSSNAAKPLGILLFCAGIYTFGYAFEIMRGDPSWTFFWIRVEYAGISFIGLCWQLVAMEFTGDAKTRKRLVLIVGLLISVIFYLSVLTNNLHHQFYTAIGTDYSGPFPTADLDKGPLYIAQAAWMYGSFLVCSVMYIRHFLAAPAILKRQALPMVLGSLIIVAHSTLYITGRIPWHLDTAPLMIAVDGCIFAFAILRDGLLEVSPIARERVFETMQEGVLICDASGAIADFNHAAKRFLPTLSKECIGMNVFLAIPELAAHSEVNDGPLLLEQVAGTHVYEVKKVPVTLGPKKKTIGVAWYIREITEQHRLLERLRDYASKDWLTGTWNRRQWDEFAEQEILKARATGHPLSLLSIDIDRFKSINDSLGHEAGDAVLIGITDRISSALRKQDLFGRMGGDEFAVLLPQTDRAEAATLAHRLLETISDYEVSSQGQRLSIAISIGIATNAAGGTKDLLALTREADQALYKAKNSGRNRACFADDD